MQLSQGNAHTSHCIQRATGQVWLSCVRDGHLDWSFLWVLPVTMGFFASEVAQVAYPKAAESRQYVKPSAISSAD